MLVYKSMTYYIFVYLFSIFLRVVFAETRSFVKCHAASRKLNYFIHLPMKMEPIVSSETSAVRTQTPGNYPKRNNLHKLKTIFFFFLRFADRASKYIYLSN